MSFGRIEWTRKERSDGIARVNPSVTSFRPPINAMNRDDEATGSHDKEKDTTIVVSFIVATHKRVVHGRIEWTRTTDPHLISAKADEPQCDHPDCIAPQCGCLTASKVGTKRKKTPNYCSVSFGRIEWTRTTDPHLIRVVL